MGADYKHITRKSIIGSCAQVMASNLTRYGHAIGGYAIWGVEADARQRIPFPCLLTNMYVRIDTPPGAGETYQFTLMVNGAPSTLDITLAGAVQVEDGPDADIVALVTGDEISMQLISSLNCFNVQSTWSIELREI